MASRTRSGRTRTPQPSGTSTPVRRGRSPQRRTRRSEQESVLSLTGAAETPDTVTKIVRRTVAGRGGHEIERVVEEERLGVPDVARRIKDSARGLFEAAAGLAGYRGSSDSDTGESDAVLFSTTRSSIADTPRQSLDFSDGEDVPTTRSRSRSRVKKRTVTTRRPSDSYKYSATPRGHLPGVTAPGVQTEMTMHQQTTIRMVNGGGRETPDKLYGLDQDDEDQEVSNTTLITASQTQGSHAHPTTPIPTETESSQLIPTSQNVREYFTGETPVVSRIGHYFAELWTRSVSSVQSAIGQGSCHYVLLALLLCLVVTVLFLVSPIPLEPGNQSETPNQSSFPTSSPPRTQNPSQQPPTPPPQQIDIEQLKRDIIEELRKDNVGGIVAADLQKRIYDDVITKLGRKEEGVRTKEGGLGAEAVKGLILSELKNRILIWENGSKVVEPPSETSVNDETVQALKREIVTELRVNINQMVADELQEKVTAAVIELNTTLTECLTRELGHQLTQQLDIAVTKQSTQFQDGFIANYTANYTITMQQIRGNISEAVAKAVGEAVAKAVGDAIGDARSAIVAGMNDRISGWERTVDQLDGKVNENYKKLSEINGSLSDLSNRTTTQENELKSAVEQTNALNRSLQQEIKQRIREALDNVTKEESDEYYQFFRDWLDNKFPGKETVKNLIDGAVDEAVVRPASGEGGQLSPAQLRAIMKAVHDNVSAALDKFSADKTGKADFALESAGGSVIDSRCSPTYISGSTYMSVYGLRLWSIVNSPRTLIQPGVLPGECWAFQGSNGSVVIKLANTIQITEFAYEHVRSNLTTNGGVKSAPKEFSVYGLADETDEEGTLLGSYQYFSEESPLQFFPVQPKVSHSYRYVQVQIQNNHGHQDYTCLYRFRVHGEATD